MQALNKFKPLGLLFVVSMLMVQAETVPAGNGPDAAIRQVMQRQVEAWNSGDIDAFMQGYKDSPDTTFIGKSLEHGYAMILSRYKKAYPDKQAMGTLEFSNLIVRGLGADHAIVTGNFHLARTTSGGGDAQGIFSLVWEKTPSGWKTILDHTSATE